MCVQSRYFLVKRSFFDFCQRIQPRHFCTLTSTAEKIDFGFIRFLRVCKKTMGQAHNASVNMGKRQSSVAKFRNKRLFQTEVLTVLGFENVLYSIFSSS